MSEFETFVNTELPRRAALLNVTIAGYDGDPNDPGAPAILQGAPTGTYYQQETPAKLWRKSPDGSWGLGVDLTEVETDIIPDADLTRSIGTGGLAVTDIPAIVEVRHAPLLWDPIYLVLEVRLNGGSVVPISGAGYSMDDLFWYLNDHIKGRPYLRDYVYATRHWVSHPGGTIERIDLVTIKRGSDASIEIVTNDSRELGVTPWLGTVTGIDAAPSPPTKRFLQAQDLVPDDPRRTIGLPGQVATKPLIRVVKVYHVPDNWWDQSGSWAMVVMVNDDKSVTFTQASGEHLAETSAQILARWQTDITNAGLGSMIEATANGTQEITIQTVAPPGSGSGKFTVLVPPDVSAMTELWDFEDLDIQVLARVSGDRLPVDLAGQDYVERRAFAKLTVDNLASSKLKLFNTQLDPTADGAPAKLFETDVRGGITIAGINSYGQGIARILTGGDDWSFPNLTAIQGGVEDTSVIEAANYWGNLVVGEMWAWDDGQVFMGPWYEWAASQSLLLGSVGASGGSTAELEFGAQAGIVCGSLGAYNGGRARMYTQGTAMLCLGVVSHHGTSGIAEIRGIGNASLCQGSMYLTQTANCNIAAQATGAYARGVIEYHSTDPRSSAAKIWVERECGYAEGYINVTVYRSATLEAWAIGSRCHGVIEATSSVGTLYACEIKAEAKASWVHGWVDGSGTVIAEAPKDYYYGTPDPDGVGGLMAFGYATANKNIRSISGGFAIGCAINADVVAGFTFDGTLQTPNCFQFGEGANYLAASNGFGTAFRLFHQPQAAPDPSYIRNGDIWRDSVSDRIWLRELNISQPLLEQVIEESGTTRILAASDHQMRICCTNAAGCAITVPPGLPANFRCAFVQMDAAGQVTVDSSGAATVVVEGSFSSAPIQTRGQYAVATIMRTLPEVYVVTGVLA